MSVSFPVFDRLTTATQTVIVQVNIHLHLPTIFAQLPVLSGNQWIPDEDLGLGVASPNAHLRPGTIIGMSYDGVHRGIKVLKGKTRDKKKKPMTFKNSIVVDMYLGPHGDVSNLKISPWGKYQLTGCKVTEQFVLPVMYFLRQIHTVFGMPIPYIPISEPESKAERKEVTVPPPVQRLPTQPRGIDFPGYQAWACVVMRNIYFDLPHAQNLQRLKEYILTRADLGFTPTYEPGFTQCMGIKARSRLSPNESANLQQTYLSVLDADLTRSDPPAYFIGTDSIKNLKTIEAMGRKPSSKKGVVEPNQPDNNLLSMILYETRKVFMSGPGWELERLYKDFCNVMIEYYKTATTEEKQAVGRSAASLLAGKRRKAASLGKKVQNASLSGSPEPVQDALAIKMNALRDRKLAAQQQLNQADPTQQPTAQAVQLP